MSVWKPNELRQALMPTLEKLYRLDPESLPFRQAVDPILLQIPVSATCLEQISVMHFEPNKSSLIMWPFNSILHVYVTAAGV